VLARVGADDHVKNREPFFKPARSPGIDDVRRAELADDGLRANAGVYLAHAAAYRDRAYAEKGSLVKRERPARRDLGRALLSQLLDDERDLFLNSAYDAYLHCLSLTYLATPSIASRREA
jgi:hypothetical protein